MIPKSGYRFSEKITLHQKGWSDDDSKKKSSTLDDLASPPTSPTRAELRRWESSWYAQKPMKRGITCGSTPITTMERKGAPVARTASTFRIDISSRRRREARRENPWGRR